MSWLKLQRDGEHWTAFNPATGLKVTASPAGRRLERTRVPELLDISVTDHCSVGCVFCVPAGTLIRVSGGVQPIELVQEGQMVWSLDERSGERVPDRVAAVQQRQYDGELVVLETDSGQQLHLTPNHEVFTRRGWTEAGEVQPNDQLRDLEGWSELRRISREAFSGTVYNFETEQHHSYYAAGLLAHNCYRDSRPGLPHASLDDLRTIARLAAEAGTFEVALGGGEITEHPHFLEVLRIFARTGLSTNFTTRRPQLVADQWAQIGPVIGAFAVSVGSVGEVDRLANLCREAGIPAARVNLHLVLGTLKEHTYRDLLETAARHGFRVTLLGYKTTGRGAAFAPIAHAWWLSGLDLARRLGLGLSIDTAVAAEYQDVLGEYGVDPAHYHTHEGRYSAFIDATHMTFSPSSYEPWRGQVPFGEDWLARYAGFQREEQENP